MIKYSKYGNIKRTYKNIKFDSIKELGRYKELEILLKKSIHGCHEEECIHKPWMKTIVFDCLIQGDV